jgi:hypothetical protein
VYVKKFVREESQTTVEKLYEVEVEVEVEVVIATVIGTEH